MQVTRLRRATSSRATRTSCGSCPCPSDCSSVGASEAVEQWMSWVHIDDAAALFRRALSEGDVDGVLNVTSPGACRQVEFVPAMARVLHRPAASPPRPGWSGSCSASRRCCCSARGGSRPAPGAELGYSFRYPSMDAAIGDVLG